MNISLRELGRIVSINYQVLMRLKRKGVYDLKPIFLHGSIISIDAQAVVLSWIYKASKMLFKRGTNKSLALVMAIKDGIQNHDPEKKMIIRFSHFEEFDCVAYYKEIKRGEMTMQRFLKEASIDEEAEEKSRTFNRFETWNLGVTEFLFRIQAIILKNENLQKAIQELEKTLAA